MSKTNLGITQKIISDMANVSVATVSRYVSHRKFIAVNNDQASRNLRYSVNNTRELINHFYKREIIKPIQAFYNFKGGTGKTSLCFQVASHLSIMGFNVLAIDADPQGHLSSSLGFDHSSNLLTLYDTVVEAKPLDFVIKNVSPGLDCIPANLSLTRLEIELNHMPKREEQVRQLVHPLTKEYDFILFDTNPTISHLNRNIITACNTINIVCELQPYSLNGLKLLIDDLYKFFKLMRMELPNILIIPNKYEDRTSSSAEAMTALNEFYSQYMIPDFAIRKSEEINTSAKLGKALAFFSKVNSIAFSDIIELIKYIIDYSAGKLKE